VYPKFLSTGSTSFVPSQRRPCFNKHTCGRSSQELHISGSQERAAAIDRVGGNVASCLPTPHPILPLAARQSPPPNSATPASGPRAYMIPFHKNWPRGLGGKVVATQTELPRPRTNAQVISELSAVCAVYVWSSVAAQMAQSMLMSASVNGRRALPSLQAGRPARLMLPLRPSCYNHPRSVSVRTMALFGKSKAKAAPAKKVRGYHKHLCCSVRVHMHARTHKYSTCSRVQ
jgi:hypothetical protein